MFELLIFCIFLQPNRSFTFKNGFGSFLQFYWSQLTTVCRMLTKLMCTVQFTVSKTTNAVIKNMLRICSHLNSHLSQSAPGHLFLAWKG
jgi:hypothetical protein